MILINKKFGGDFEFDESFLVKNFPFKIAQGGGIRSLIYFSCARSALYTLLKYLKIKSAILPLFICDSVICAFRALNTEISFYKINPDLTIDLDSFKNNLKPNSAIFLMHYFGKIQEQEILDKIKDLSIQNNSIIIEDTTHSIFSSAVTIGDYCISSLRKWFFVPEGGILYSNKDIDIKLNSKINENFLNCRKKAQQLKSCAIKNQTKDESYLEYFCIAEKMLENDYFPYSMSDYSKEIIEKFDYLKMIEKRKENFLTLQEEIKNPLITKLIEYKKGQTYLQYPILIKNRDEFRKYLFKYNIFCAIHWVAPKNINKDLDFYLNNNIISLMIDQRYSISDMKYIASIINKYSGSKDE